VLNFMFKKGREGRDL